MGRMPLYKVQKGLILRGHITVLSQIIWRDVNQVNQINLGKNDIIK